jgi:uncharacterized Rmd1/YagE family protein
MQCTLMDCCAFCAASAYNIKPLSEVMRAHYKTRLYRDVVYVAIKREQVTCEAFIFSYGAAVFWGVNAETGLKILKEDISPFEEHPLPDIDQDVFTYEYGDSASVADDEIILPSDSVLTKLAISQGLAQSVRIGAFEASLQKTFKLTKQLPEDLANYGKISLSRKEMRRKMGELFIARNSVNLNMDVLDTPEFFWEHPELDPLYRMISNYLDIRTRVEILNQRLGVMHDLFEMLGTELNYSHSTRLEWAVIGLIFIEVIISLVINVFHLI